MSELVLTNTPWEVHELDGMAIHVKREDLCCPSPGPSFSKIRGVEAFLKKQEPGTPIGVLDTAHSKAGWGVAYVCADLGLPCYDFYPVNKAETGMRPFQLRAQEFGAEMRPLKAGRSAILYHQARKLLAEEAEEGGLMMPNALKLVETVEATAREAVQFTPDGLCYGTWVISISSGTIAAGVIMAVGHLEGLCTIAHMGYSRSKDAARKYMLDMAGVVEGDVDLIIVDEGYAYKDLVKLNSPFPCNPYYDLKAWKWLSTHAHNLEEPIVFWNIGT